MGPRLLNLLPPWETSFFNKVNKFHVFECFKQLLVKCTHVWKKVQKCASVHSHISDTWPKFTLCISSIGFLLTPSVHILVFCWPLQYTYWFFVDPFSTCIGFLLTPSVLKSTLVLKGSRKKPIRYWFFVDPFSTKIAFVNQKVRGFHLTTMWLR